MWKFQFKMKRVLIGYRAWEWEGGSSTRWRLCLQRQWIFCWRTVVSCSCLSTGDSSQCATNSACCSSTNSVSRNTFVFVWEVLSASCFSYGFDDFLLLSTTMLFSYLVHKTTALCLIETLVLNRLQFLFLWNLIVEFSFVLIVLSEMAHSYVVFRRTSSSQWGASESASEEWQVQTPMR